MSPVDNCVRINGLSKTFGSIKALEDVTLDVPRGKVFGLVGPNGSGKTTLIKAICGILRPDRGSVNVLGIDVLKNRLQVRRQLGYMPQSPSLYEDLSPVENLLFFGGAYNPPGIKKRIRESLEFVRLWDRRDDPLYTFSGGMKQRASLACALLHDPELLLLDEPTAGVDPTLKEDFWRRFDELCKRGHTIFLSTNMMEEALRCDRLSILLKGGILVSDTPEVLKNRGTAKVTLELKDGRRVEKMARYQEELPKLLAEYGLSPEVTKISIKRQSLEEVVLSLIEEAQ